MGVSNITFGYIHHPLWRNALDCEFDLARNTDVWRICVSANVRLTDLFSDLMTQEERAQANRFFRLRDKQRFIITRGAIRIILGKYLAQNAADIRFVQGKNKKPYLKGSGDAAIFFNISHTADWITIAISKTEMGIDIEHVDANFNFSDLILEFFSQSEVAFINETSSAARFFLLWTRKEALIKATAKGIDDDIRLIPALDGTHTLKTGIISSVNNWYINSFTLADHYVASVALSSPDDKITFWDWQTAPSSLI